jgi:hypothetical protein
MTHIQNSPRNHQTTFLTNFQDIWPETVILRAFFYILKTHHPGRGQFGTRKFFFRGHVDDIIINIKALKFDKQHHQQRNRRYDFHSKKVELTSTYMQAIHKARTG